MATRTPSARALGVAAFKRWLVSGALSEANAVRHASVASGARSNPPSVGSADQASPFASMLDQTSDTSSPPASAWPASPQPPNQKLAGRPQDGQAAQPAAREPAPPPQQSPSDRPAHENQTGSVSSKGPQGTGIGDPALALAKKAAKNSTDANGGAIVTNRATDATGGNNAVDATEGGSTTAAVTDVHDDKPAKSDAGTSDAAQAATPLVDPSANQPVSAQPVAVPVNAPLLPAAPTGTGNAGGSDGSSGQDDAAIAALGDAVKSDPLRGKAAGTASATSGGAGSDSVAGAGAKPGSRTADAGASTPSLTPQAAQKELNLLTGAGQPNGADGTQSRNGVAATETAANHARQQATDNLQTTGTASSLKVDPNSDSKPDPAGPTTVIEDIVRQALDTPNSTPRSSRRRHRQQRRFWRGQRPGRQRPAIAGRLARAADPDHRHGPACRAKHDPDSGRHSDCRARGRDCVPRPSGKQPIRDSPRSAGARSHRCAAQCRPRRQGHIPACGRSTRDARHAPTRCTPA